MHVSPARTNDRTIAGPESPMASPMMTKMPVPMIAPRPSAVRSRAPTARRRPLSSFSWTTVSTSFVASSADVAMAPTYPPVCTGKPFGYGSYMENDESQTEPQHDTTTPEDIEQQPRGNPESDQESVDKGVDQLERIKPY
jgi:hypothetical protein